MKASKITKVKFTWAMPEGMWVERENGDRNWESHVVLSKEVGHTEWERINKIAHHGGRSGMWYSV